MSHDLPASNLPFRYCSCLSAGFNCPDGEIYGADCPRSSSRPDCFRRRVFVAVSVAYRWPIGRGNGVSPEGLAQVSRDLYNLDLGLHAKWRAESLKARCGSNQLIAERAVRVRKDEIFVDVERVRPPVERMHEEHVDQVAEQWGVV